MMRKAANEIKNRRVWSLLIAIVAAAVLLIQSGVYIVTAEVPETEALMYEAEENETAAENDKVNASENTNENGSEAESGTSINDTEVIYEAEEEETTKALTVSAGRKTGIAAVKSDGIDLGVPEHHKTLTKNTNADGAWDGTYTLSLDVTGKEAETHIHKKADVIVIQDISASMNSRRINASKSALTALANQLFAENTAEYPDTVQMSLIKFATRATIANSGTTSKETFLSEVNKIAAQSGEKGGTNWEDALQVANSMSIREDSTPYVIFISDGEPTFRMTKGPYNDDSAYYREYGVYGTGLGRDENVSRCYEYAKDDARNIVNDGKEFFVVSAFERTNRMQSLVRYAYNTTDEGVHYQEADDEASLKQAFANIVEQITNHYGYMDVSAIDRMSSLAEVAAPGGTPQFSYFKDDAVWSDAPQAIYTDDGRIKWDLSSIGLLEEGVTYRISFTVYPNQDALDLIADFKNGIKEYDPEEYPEITLDENGEYNLFSNESGTLEYRQVITSNGVMDPGPLEHADYERPQMGEQYIPITVRKIWDDEEDPSMRPVGEDGKTVPVTLTMLKDGNEYMTFVLSDDNSWQKTIYVAPGIISTTVQSDPLINGHEYTIEEQDIPEGYELVAGIKHPMIVDGETIYGESGDAILTAVNRLLPGPVSVLPATGGKTFASEACLGAAILLLALIIMIRLPGEGH